LANSGSKQREEFKKSALLTDCYTRRAEMDGKTKLKQPAATSAIHKGRKEK
jgi:hypothetical protein